MTDDRNPADVPTRALDDVTPPDQWDDITARAALPEAAVEPLPLVAISAVRRPYVLAAAAVMAVLAIATVLVLTQRDEGDDTVVAGPSAAGRLDDPASAFGRRWELKRLSQNGEDIALIAIAGYPPATLDLTVTGEVTFRRCYPESASATVQGDRLVVGEEWRTANFPCTAPEGEALTVLDDALAEVLFATPVVELSGDRLTLESTEGVAELVEVTGWPDGTPDPTDPTEPDDETGPESRVPETEWVYVDLTEPPFGQRTWVLISIEVAGSVTDPLDTGHGGGDGSGGAPALVMGDRTSVVLEGCGIITLRTETRGTLPWLGLPVDQSTFAGCGGDSGEQHGQILKFLSVGAFPAFHETDDGSVLVLANEEGTLVFRDASAGN